MRKILWHLTHWTLSLAVCLSFKCCLTENLRVDVYPQALQENSEFPWLAKIMDSRLTVSVLPSISSPSKKIKVFESYSKCRIWIFQFWHFPPIFVLLKVTCLVTLFDLSFGPFLAFLTNFCRIKMLNVQGSLLRSQCWMRLFSVILKHYEWNVFYSI